MGTNEKYHWEILKKDYQQKQYFLSDFIQEDKKV